MSIRDYVINNFKGCNKEEIKSSITSSLKENADETLPGLGVFFEVVWNGSSDDLKNQIISIIEKDVK